MAIIYYRSVKRGDRTLEQVPKLWRAKVKKMLEEEADADGADS